TEYRSPCSGWPGPSTCRRGTARTLRASPGRAARSGDASASPAQSREILSACPSDGHSQLLDTLRLERLLVFDRHHPNEARQVDAPLLEHPCANPAAGELAVPFDERLHAGLVVLVERLAQH